MRGSPIAAMIKFLVRRLAFAIVLVFAVSSASLLLARLAPGDYATESLELGAHASTLARARARIGADKPISAQYRDWLVGLTKLDFGRSLAYDRPIAELIPERAANTAILADPGPKTNGPPMLRIPLAGKSELERRRQAQERIAAIEKERKLVAGRTAMPAEPSRLTALKIELESLRKIALAPLSYANGVQEGGCPKSPQARDRTAL